jgi:uncharacterized protein (DUF2345 family)
MIVPLSGGLRGLCHSGKHQAAMAGKHRPIMAGKQRAITAGKV